MHAEPSAVPAPPGFFRSIREALSGVQHDYTRGSLNRAITLLAVPMVLEMAMESLFAVCDLFFVKELGDEAVAAVGLTESMLTIVYAIAIGLCMGTTATVARRVGEGNLKAASAAGVQALYLGLAVAVLIGVPCIFLAPRLLELMAASPKVIEIGSGYAGIMLGFNAVIIFVFLNNAIFRGAGDAIIAMKSLWLANGINIVLDPCLIFGLGPFPELGLEGAAIATCTGRGIGVLYQLWALSGGKSRLRVTRESLGVDPAAMLRLLRVSLGGIGQFLIAMASWIMLMRIMAPFGDAALAGYQISIRILLFALLPSFGLSNAAATLVGQNLGAGQPDRAERSVWMTGVYNMVFLGVVTILMLVFAEPIVGIFTKETARGAPSAVIAVRSLRVISYGYIFYAWGMVMVQAFNGAGDTATPTWINLVCFWMIQIPGAWMLARGIELGPDGIFWAVCGAESLIAVVAMILFRRGRWKAKVV